MGEVVLAVLLGVGFLHAFYRVVESDWPGSYYAVSRTIDRTISANPLRYTLFRFGPMYLIGVFVGAVLGEGGEPVVIPVLMIAVLHGAATSGRAVYGIVQRGRLRDRPLALALHVLIMVVLALVGVIAAVTASAFEDLVPTNEDLAVALWTALFAGLVGAFLVRITTARGVDESDAFGRSRRSIPDSLWVAAEAGAVEAGAEPRLVHAFLLVENIQRPSWTRALERIGGRIIGAGSYGPLQVSSGEPMGDPEALEKAVAQRFAGRWVPRTSHGWPDHKWLRLLALSYNPDKTYADNVAPDPSRLHPAVPACGPGA